MFLHKISNYNKKIFHLSFISILKNILIKFIYKILLKKFN